MNEQQAIAAAIAALQALAKDIRRPRPIDWTPEEADERTARRIEAIAQKLHDDTRQ
jgi:hypothetical protein